CDEVDRALAQPRLRQIESAPRSLDHLALAAIALGHLLHADQAVLHVGEGGDHRVTIDLQQLFLVSLRLVEQALEAEAVEHTLPGCSRPGGASGRTAAAYGPHRGCRRRIAAG